MALPNWMTMNWLDKYRDVGLLLMRIGAGVVFIYIGWEVLADGDSGWRNAGNHFQDGIGVKVQGAAVYFGLTIAIAELLGGICVLLGFATRFAATLIFVILLASYPDVWDDGVNRWSQVALSALLFLGLMVMGPGKYSLDVRNADEIADH